MPERRRPARVAAALGRGLYDLFIDDTPELLLVTIVTLVVGALVAGLWGLRVLGVVLVPLLVVGGLAVSLRRAVTAWTVARSPDEEDG